MLAVSVSTSGLNCEGARVSVRQGAFCCHFLHKALIITQTGLMAYYTVSIHLRLAYPTITWEDSRLSDSQARMV